jgi:predicted lipid-binding transport protein (Tim44 family)
VTSSTDIRAVADESARRVLGRKFSAEELQRFTESYQQQEIATQQAGAGVSEAAPSVATAAEAFAERVDPSQANAYRFLGFFDQLSSSLRSRI